ASSGSRASRSSTTSTPTTCQWVLGVSMCRNAASRPTTASVPLPPTDAWPPVRPVTPRIARLPPPRIEGRRKPSAWIHARVPRTCDPHDVTDAVDLETPIPFDCLRCGTVEPMRFRGLCARCRAEVVSAYQREARDIEVAAYEPKMNVTPNAVALKDD